MDVFFPFVVDLDEFVVAVELVQSQASVVDRNLTDGVGDLRRTFSVPVCAGFNVIRRTFVPTGVAGIVPWYTPASFVIPIIGTVFSASVPALYSNSTFVISTRAVTFAVTVTASSSV